MHSGASLVFRRRLKQLNITALFMYSLLVSFSFSFPFFFSSRVRSVPFSSFYFLFRCGGVNAL